MNRLHLEKREGIARIILDDGKVNAIQDELLSQLDVALDTAERDPDLRAVVLAGRDGFFSAGMDLKLLPTLGEAELRRTLLHLAQTTTRLFMFPKPCVAAVTGHAIAGGAVLALCCDLRMVAEGNHRIGLSEVAIGIALPAFVVGFGAATIPAPMLAPMLLHGALLEPAEALRTGIVHELHPPWELIERATQKALKLAELGSPAYAITKQRLRGAQAQAALDQMPAEMDAFSQSFRSKTP
jgi:enoyl-CoA hydratase/carnithine racemase